MFTSTVDSRYLEFDGTMEKIRVNRSSTQEELRRYRKYGLFNSVQEELHLQGTCPPSFHESTS